MPSPELDRRLVGYPDAVPYKDRQQRNWDPNEKRRSRIAGPAVACDGPAAEPPARLLPFYFFILFHCAEHFIMVDLDRDVSILKVWLCDAWQIRSRHHRL